MAKLSSALKAAQAARPRVPEGETREEKFVRLANVRVTRALKALGRIATLGNRANYAYTPDQSAKIIDAIDAAIRDVVRAYIVPDKDNSSLFTL